MNDEEALEVKAVLWSYRDALERFVMAQQSLEAAQTALTSISIDYGKDRVQATPVSPDRIGDLVDKLNRLRNDCIERLNEYLDVMREVARLIDGVTDYKLHEILRRRYILRQGFEQIAYEMSYDYRHVRRLHKKALGQVWEEMRETDETERKEFQNRCG